MVVVEEEGGAVCANMSEEQDGFHAHRVPFVALWVLVLDLMLWLAWLLQQVNL